MKLRWLSLCLLLSQSVSGQLNVELLSNLDFPDRGNDVWGYNAPDGREYALMGTFETLTIVDITEPTNPVELFRIPQQESIWRDIKTWKNYAYVIADQPNSTDGVLVIDLSGLPNSIDFENKTIIIEDETNPVNNQILERSHNLYIDENGYAYLAGCAGGTLIDSNQKRINEGGLLIFDVDSTPGELDFVAKGPAVYSHDIFVQDDKAYSSEIYEGQFSIYDVSEKNNIQFLGGYQTPSEFTHNTWASADGNFLYTTDELSNAFIGAYDISDPANIVFLDSFRPNGSLGKGTIPHNVHVWNDWLVISYYTDGCVIVDASNPRNLVEVGNYDTYSLDSVGFKGAWGAYPFLDSENIIVGDIETGLYVFDPDYKQAAKLEGHVYDAETGETINAVAIEITEEDLLEFSKTDGYYGTGTAKDGIYTVLVSRTGYREQTLTVELVCGEVLVQDIYLKKKQQIDLTGQVTIQGTNAPIEDVEIAMWKDGQLRTLYSDSQGRFNWTNIREGSYYIVAGKWGYRYNVVGQVIFSETTTDPVLEIVLEKGYEDIFTLDMGWESEFDGNTGEWFRSVPIGTVPPNLSLYVGPNYDSNDRGARAFVTGHSQSFDLGLLKGTATLTSPSFDVTYMDDPYVRFAYWYWATDDAFNFFGETLKFYLDNGIEKKLVKELAFDRPQQLQWELDGFNIKEFMDVTADMRLTVEATAPLTGTIVEAGLDNFRVIESASVSTDDALGHSSFLVYPNPSSNKFHVRSKESERSTIDQVRLLDMHGKVLKAYDNNTNVVTFGEDLDSGIYFLELIKPSGQTEIQKIIKTQ